MSRSAYRPWRGAVAVGIGAALLGGMVAAGPAFAADEPSPTVALNLLNINDFHGRIDANTVKFAGTIEQLRAQYGEDNTLFLSDGDNIGASLFASAYFDDEPTLEVLNALDLAASAVGNHEFDKGLDDLQGRVADAAQFPYLGANVYAKGTTDPVLPEYAAFEVDGLRVAVIGAVTDETSSLVSPEGIATLDFGDPVAAVNRVAAALTDGDVANGEADVIIAEYHEGAVDGASATHTLDDELALGGAFARIVTDTAASVDVIFTGHTHKTYVWDGPIAGTDRTRPIVQTGNYGENIGQVVLTVDAATGEVASYTAANVARSTASEDDLVAAYPRAAQVKEIVDRALADAAAVGEQPVGAVTADITTAFAGGSVVDGVYAGGTRDDRASQSTLGNLVADSLVESLSDPARGGAEIGVVNPGGLRSELLYGADGVITYAEANAVLPFVNNLWTTTLTGAQFREALEQQWQPDGSSRPYLALGLSSNVSYTYDAAAARGERITGVWIDGTPLDPAASYRVGSFSFLLAGGDNFTALAQGVDTRDSGLIDRDAWISYISENSPLSPSFASRSAQVTGVPATIAAGETLSIEVSGLDLNSLGSPANTTLEARIGDTVYPPFAVTAGAVTVDLVVPTRLAGPVVLVLTAPDSGTQVTVPLTVTAAIDPELPGTGGSERPTTTPDPVADAQLTPATQGGISVVSGERTPGGTLTVRVGTAHAGEWVAAWLHSDPVFLGWHLVDATGEITVTLPAAITGAHRLVIVDADGEVIGWQSLTITAATPVATAAPTTALPSTGGDASGAAWTALLAALVLLAGAGLAASARARGRGAA